MNTITLPTNLHCGRCVDKLAAVLNGHPAVASWSADVSGPLKTVTLTGALDKAQAASLIGQAGFKTIQGPVDSCPVPVEKKSARPGFWSDARIWKKAAFNTANCLLGCSIGDFGMIIFLQVYYPATPMWLQMGLAIIAGLVTSVALETWLLHRREKLAWRAALRMALSMSFLSMVAMELAMNGTDFMITGGKAQLSSLYYWAAFLPAAVAGFLAPLPYNYFQLKKYNRACH